MKPDREEWKEGGQYAAEWESVHAPAELVAGTKQKAAAEEARQRAIKKQVKRYLPLAAAAAVLVLAFSFSMRKDTGADGAPMLPYLGSAEGDAQQEAGLLLSQTAVLPMAFMQDDVWTEEVAGILVRFVQREDGAYMAAYADNAGYTVAVMHTTDREAFLDEVRILLQNGGNENEDRK